MILIGLYSKEYQTVVVIELPYFRILRTHVRTYVHTGTVWERGLNIAHARKHVFRNFLGKMQDGGEVPETTTVTFCKQEIAESKQRSQSVSEMVPPAVKRLCSTVSSAVRRIAVEGNIGGWHGQWCGECYKLYL